MATALTRAARKSEAPHPNGALSIEVRSDRIAIVTYDVPGESVNSLQTTFAQEFEEMLDRIEHDAAIDAVVLMSGKADSFVVGANVEMLQRCKTAADAESLSRGGQSGFRRLAESGKPFVAAVHGAALGGGFELALACRGRVCSDDKKTSFGLPEIQLGLIPGANGLLRLADKVGLQQALDFGLTGKTLRPAKAKKLGIVDEVVPKALLLESAVRRAKAIVQGTRGKKSVRRMVSAHTSREFLQTILLERNPLGRRLLFRKARALTMEKTKGHFPAAMKVLEVLEAYGSDGFDAAADVEARAFGELVVSETAHQLMGIFFATQALKKDTGIDVERARGRESVHESAHAVDKIGVLGAGLMGAGIAYVSTTNGFEVRLKDKDDAGLGRGLAHVEKLLATRVKRRQLASLDKATIDARLSGTTGFEGFGRCGLVIEAVFEDLALKRAVLADVEAKCDPSTLFASNTSSIPIGAIAEGCKRPQNVVGMHYFSPVEKMPLLEVIRHKGSSDEAVATAVAVGKRQGKTVIVVNDGVGFYTSRILGPFMNEAAWLLSEGVPIEAIDRALTEWGFPVGPMTLLDEVGIDVASHVAGIVHEAFGDRMSPPPMMEKLVADDRKGRKNKRGMYLYDDAGKKRRDPKGDSAGKNGVDTSVYRALGIRPIASASNEDIQARCVLAFVNEALRCLGEGVLRSARDGDVGAVFGLGFPPFRGGPFRYVDTVGAPEILRRTEALRARFGARFDPAPTLVNLARINGRFYKD